MTQNVNPDPVPPPTPTPPGGAPLGVSPLNYGTAAAGPVYEGPLPDQDSKTMGMLAHLLGIVTFWLGPLIIWLVKKDTSPFVNDQGKEALNWEITLTIPVVASVVFRFIFAFVPFLRFVGCLLSLLILAIWVVNLIFCIQGAMAASKGVAYRYPFALRLIK